MNSYPKLTIDTFWKDEKIRVSEWVIRFNGLSGDSRQQGPYGPYKSKHFIIYIRED